MVTRRTPDGAWSEPKLVAEPGSKGEWSPDGQRIAYVSSTTDYVAGTAMVMSLGGGEVRRLFEPSTNAPPAGMVVWGPDGQTLYFKAHDALGRTSFWSVRVEGGQPRLLVRFPDPDRQSSRADFATDGVRFYFAIEDRRSDVFVAELLKP